MTDEPTVSGFSCSSCSREIPAAPLWTALARRARLHCSGCGNQVRQDDLRRQAEASEIAKALLVSFGQLQKFGWVSSDSLENAGVAADPKTIGGLLTGLTRAGLIRRGSSTSDLAVLIDRKPVFVPGPKYPGKTIIR